MSTRGLIQIFFDVSDVLVHSVSERSFALSYILFPATVTRDQVYDIACFAVIGTFLLMVFW